MSDKQKYRELVELLREVGILQLDTDWAEQIQQMIKRHKESKS